MAKPESSAALLAVDVRLGLRFKPAVAHRAPRWHLPGVVIAVIV